MTETQYWHKLRKLIAPRVNYAWKINANYQAGIPDAWLSGIRDLWVENKRVASVNPPLVLDLTDHKKYLSMHQQLWLERRHAEGRNVGVIVFSKVGHIYLPGLSWKGTVSREDYLAAAMTLPQLADKIVEFVGKVELK